MNLCRSCNGSKRIQVFTNPETNHRVVGFHKLHDLCYEESNKMLDHWREEFFNTKPELKPVGGIGTGIKDPSIGYQLQKMTDKEFIRLQSIGKEKFHSYDSASEPCPDCGEIFEEYYQKSSHKVVHKGLILDLIEKKIISKDFKTHIEKDYTGFCVTGETRRGKTLFLKYTFNKILNSTKDPKRLYYVSEMELFEQCRDEKTFKQYMNQIKLYDYIFIDELFATENWKDSNADRDKATITHRNIFTFWDTLSQTSKKVFATSNHTFGLYLPNKGTERIIERIKEICTIIEVK